MKQNDKHWVEGFAFGGEESFKIAECDTATIAILVAKAVDLGQFKTKFINEEFGSYRIRVVNWNSGDVIWEGR